MVRRYRRLTSCEGDYGDSLTRTLTQVDDRAVVKTQTVGALVIGGEHPGLGVARSLGRRGIPVYVVDDQWSIASCSRYTSRFVQVNDLRDARKTIDNVLEVGHRYGLQGWVLFPTRDETVAAFGRYRDELKSFFRVTTPEWGSVKWAWNKKNTYDLAKHLGIPCPETFTARSADELQALYPRLPLAVKPAVKEDFFYATGAKAWRAETPEELQKFYHEATTLQIDPADILIQEIIPGDGSSQFSYCAFYRDGHVHSSLLARRTRQHPREFGRAATYVETVESVEIEELSERFLKAIDYYGLVEIEFKKDVRDGQFKLLDVNARTWGFHTIGSAAGVDFPYLLYADQIGQSAPSCRGKAGVGWLRLITDLPWALWDIVRGQLGWRPYLSSLRRTRVESVFCRRDPLPSLAEIACLPYLIAKKYIC